MSEYADNRLDRYTDALIKIQCVCSRCIETQADKRDAQRIMELATQALTPKAASEPKESQRCGNG